MKEIKNIVVNKENFQGVATTFLENGVCPYTNKTENDYLKEGYLIA